MLTLDFELCYEIVLIYLDDKYWNSITPVKSINSHSLLVFLPSFSSTTDISTRAPCGSGWSNSTFDQLSPSLTILEWMKTLQSSLDWKMSSFFRGSPIKHLHHLRGEHGGALKHVHVPHVCLTRAQNAGTSLVEVAYINTPQTLRSSFLRRKSR